MHFVLIDHVYCSRHILENVQRHLTDGGIDVKTRQQIVNLVNRCSDVSCDSSSASDNAVDQLMESVRLQAPEHVDYFTRHVIPKLQHNITVKYNVLIHNVKQKIADILQESYRN